MPADQSLVAGRYRLEAVLGEGGMGTVWTGRDELLGRRVAVKEVRTPPGLSDRDRDVLHERMMREARLTARLNDPRVITVYDVVLHDDRPYIVMELVPSRSLDQELDASGPMPPQRVATVGLEVLAALDLAHRQGIVHRDIKPSNVLLADDGRVVLTDFGIATTESDATLTSTGLLVGSPTYMAPERLRGEQVGPKADLWSLGATLYAASEARPPFQAPTTMGTISAILTDDVPVPSVGGPLRDALLGLLDKDPARRLDSQQALHLLQQATTQRGGATTTLPATASVMAPAGAGYVWVTDEDPDAAPVASSTPQAPPPDPKPRRSRWLAVLAALAVLALLVGAAAALLLNGPDDTSTGDGANAGGRDRRASQTTPTTEPEPKSTPTETESTETEPPETKTSETQDPEEESPETEGTVPSGYKLHTDELGFSLAVPKGWERRVDGSQVDFVSPDGTQFLRIGQVPQAEDDAKDAWLDQEESVSESLAGYQRIRIEDVEYRDWEAADWEFTWEGSGGTIHVLDRGFITDPRGFAIYMSAPDSVWESEGLPTFQAAADSFTPLD